MATNPLFSPNFLHTFSTTPTQTNLLSFTSLQSTSIVAAAKRRLLAPPPLVASIPYPQPPINTAYLEQEFSGHGVTFEDIGGGGGGCIAKMVLENGSSATLMLPSGLVTSYKAPMWHGGTMELLHTIVSEGDGGEAVIQGGISLAFGCENEGEFERFPSNWGLFDIKGNSQDSIQVELISRDTEDMVEMTYIVKLEEDILSSEIAVTNNNKYSSIKLSGSILSHLTVSTPEATYVVGMEGSDYFNRSSALSNFAIIPQNEEQESKFGIGQWWNNVRRNGENGGEEMEGEETDNYKQLTEKMSRIYTNAPTNLTFIDRGRRNSVVAGRHGFNELYIFSPGSRHEFYSKYAYICTGPSAVLKPIVIGPGNTWRGKQVLHNPNT